MHHRKVRRAGLGLALTTTLATLGACGDAAPTGPGRDAAAAPSLALVAPAPTIGTVVVCKEGSSGQFTATRSAAVGTLNPAGGVFNLADGSCQTVWTATTVVGQSNPKITIAVTEAAPAGFHVADIQVTSTQCDVCMPHNPAPAAQVNVAAGTVTVTGYEDYGYVIVFRNAPDGPNCTHTIGYWKNHAGGPRKTDVVTALLPVSLGTPAGPQTVTVTTASQARLILGMAYLGGHPSNGITKLYAQLLGAKLSIESGASGAAIAGTISAADGFLALNNQGAWASMSASQRALVLQWMSMLDAYNNGEIGPGHCD